MASRIHYNSVPLVQQKAEVRSQKAEGEHARSASRPTDSQLPSSLNPPSAFCLLPSALQSHSSNRMPRFRDLSIRTKLMTGFMLTSLVPLLITMQALGMHDRSTMR